MVKINAEELERLENAKINANKTKITSAGRTIDLNFTHAFDGAADVSQQVVAVPTTRKFLPSSKRPLQYENIISNNEGKVEVYIVDDVNEMKGKKGTFSNRDSDWWADTAYTTREDDLISEKIKKNEEIDDNLLGDMIKQKRKMVITENEARLLDALGKTQGNRYHPFDYGGPLKDEDVARAVPAYKTIVDENTKTGEIGEPKGYIISPAAEYLIRLKRREAKNFKDTMEEADERAGRGRYSSPDAGLFYKKMIVEGNKEVIGVGKRKQKEYLDGADMMEDDILSHAFYSERRDRVYGSVGRKESRVYIGFPYLLDAKFKKPHTFGNKYISSEPGKVKLGEVTNNTQSAGGLPKLSKKPPSGTIQRGLLGDYYMYWDDGQASHKWKKLYFEQIVLTEKGEKNLRKDKWETKTNRQGLGNWRPDYIPMNDYHMAYLHRRSMGYGSGSDDVDDAVVFQGRDKAYNKIDNSKKPRHRLSDNSRWDYDLMTEPIYVRGNGRDNRSGAEWLSEITMFTKSLDDPTRDKPPTKAKLENVRQKDMITNADDVKLSHGRHLMAHTTLKGGKTGVSLHPTTARIYRNSYSANPIALDYEPRNKIVLYNPNGDFDESKDGQKWPSTFHGKPYGEDIRLPKVKIDEGKYGDIFNIDVRKNTISYRHLPTIIQENYTKEESEKTQIPDKDKTFEDYSDGYVTDKDKPYRPYDKKDIGNAQWFVNAFEPTHENFTEARASEKGWHGPVNIEKSLDSWYEGEPIVEPDRSFIAIAAPTMILTGLEEAFDTKRKKNTTFTHTEGKRTIESPPWVLSPQPIIDRMPEFYKFQGKEGTWMKRNKVWAKEQESLREAGERGREQLYKKSRTKKKELMF